jgi:hypothetical protein
MKAMSAEVPCLQSGEHMPSDKPYGGCSKRFAGEGEKNVLARKSSAAAIPGVKE